MTAYKATQALIRGARMAPIRPLWSILWDNFFFKKIWILETINPFSADFGLDFHKIDKLKWPSQVFKIPRDAEFPPPLQPHIESIKDITDRLQTIYTDAEVNLINF